MPIIKALPRRPEDGVTNPALAGWLDLIWQLIKSDVYTPTLTDVTNLDGSTTAECKYTRIGHLVTVYFRVSANPTAAAATELGMSLPIPATFTSANDLAGALGAAIATEAGLVDADTTNHRASLRWTAVSTANHNIAGSFQYKLG